MTLFDSPVSVTIVIADYIAIDTTGKINVIGGGVGFTPLQPSGHIPAMSVFAAVEVSSRFVDQEVVLELELHDETENQVVMTQVNQGAPVEALRIAAQPAPLQRALPTGVPGGTARFARASLLIGFPAGIPLEPNKTYAWKLKVNGRGRPSWKSSFHVLGAPPRPVVGGPAGDAAIEGLQIPVDQDEPFEEPDSD